jgi:hypothetical protein
MTVRRLLFLTIPLLLLIPLITFWIRSYRHEEAVNYRTNSLTHYVLIPFNGSLHLEINYEAHGRFGNPRGTSTGYWSYSFPPDQFIPRRDPLEFIHPIQFNRLGFAWANGYKLLSIPSPPGSDLMGLCDEFPTIILACPFWLLTLLALSPPARILIGALLLRRRRAQGLCPKCQYDRRAHQPGQKCPECGTVVAPQAAR